MQGKEASGAAETEARHGCLDRPGWSKNVFLHVLPAGRPGSLPERVHWVTDHRLSDRRGAFGAWEPVARGSIDFARLDPASLPAAVSRMATSLCDPDSRVFSCCPSHDGPLLRSLMEAAGCCGTIDIRAFSECLEQEALDLYSCFPAGGRDCRDLVSTMASTLVADACAELAADGAAAGGRV